MATGHYIQRKTGLGGAELHRAADPIRDQSYFLFSTTPDQLDYLRFPLGHLKSKEETRDLARKYGLVVADKPDSQDICFVPNGSYAAVIEKLRPGAAEPGAIVHLDGRVLGEHKGVIHYTIGQRRGLGIGGGEPYYVVKLDADTKEVVVGPKEALATRTISVKEINWLGNGSFMDAGEDGWDVEVKIRSTRPSRDATIRPLTDRTAQVTLVAAEEGAAPGQACVFYERNTSRVLGGGWITRD